MFSLVDRLAERVKSGVHVDDMERWRKAWPYAPATLDQVLAAERRLRFPLPELLRDIYLRVGNGGFGPGYGLIGIGNGAPEHVAGRECRLVELYKIYRQPDGGGWRWPERLLPICHWGCAIYSCVDCSSPRAPIIGYDPNTNPDPPGRQPYLSHFNSFAEWIELWLQGVDVGELMYRGPAPKEDDG